ncbi:hypothetical protein A1O1_02752 [Capronia coronata CBS 617.96]|uniref:Uncharacterized protein n=1 Tax=Capronia coronata CBS 617.96 TaxID=1182541 RepID=W9YPB2_9EURO|nr:uncharacterized protein A1O1_02752 [Capronia coronata CBS 617.96]EXJ94358.1 hypothetical protein A1O1_02752 [Capronia coronata CBS 617.96]
MSSRRTLSDQPRNWSQESSSSQEELILYRGNRIVEPENPERQPKNPPSDAQADEGFVRFLKKHASPTHQRVTAGGRIVPMEHRTRPPVCQLADCKPHPESERKNNTGEGVATNTEGPKSEASNQVKPKLDSSDILAQSQPQLHVQLPMTNAMIANNAFNAGINVNLVSPGDALALDNATAQSQHWLAPIPSAPGGPTMFPDPYYLQSPQLFPSCAMPLTPPVSGFNGTLDGQYPVAFVPFPDMMGFPGPTDMPIMTGELAQAEASSLDHMIAGATARFQELDRQLKMIDRHRAMRVRDPYLSEHRMAVVEMRANAKSEISYWSNLASEAKSAPKWSGGAGSTLNVEAAAYVPLQTGPIITASPSKPGSVLKANDYAVQLAQPKASPKAGRRGIPIVPPPETSDLTVKKAKDAPPTQPSSSNVDEWGVRLGVAPPDLLRQQDELAKVLIREASMSPQKFASNGSSGSSLASHNTSPLHDSAIESSPDVNEENKAESDEWLPTNPGRAPATVEACYELQLDAMRLPKGIISKVRLPDGTITEVRGRGLQRPPSLGMDDFERRYWKSKPVLTKEMTSQFVGIRACDEPSAVEEVLEYLDSNHLNGAGPISSRNTPFKENTKGDLSGSSSASSDRFRDDLRDAAKGGLPAANRPREHGHKEHHSATFGSNGSDPSMLTFKQSSASSTPLWLRGDDRVGWFASEPSQEAGINKGYTSVSVQNVHAIGRLPHMLDGTTDSQRRSAKLMLSAAGKRRSPHRGHSATTASDAFPGPTGRTGRSPANGTDDGVQNTIGTQEEL